MKNVLQPTDERLLTVVLFIISLSVYATTVCPTVSFTDNGELATVASTLGIAHPTGYPLFSILGRIASLTAPAATTIGWLNFAAAIVTATGVCLFFHVLLTARRAVRLFGGKEPSGHIFVIASFIGAGALAFTETVWSQATALEVYGLHLVLVMTATLFFLRGLEEQLRVPGTASRSLLMFAFALGLSFANHMTTVLLAPAFLYLYYSALGFNTASHRRVLRLGLFFLIALSLYAYLPIRSVAQPPVDWGHPVTWERFVRHVSGSQYRVWMFSGAEVMQKQFLYFFSHFFSEYHAVLFPLIALGWWASVRRGRRLSVFLHLLAITTLLYATNYDIFDIDSYFLTVYVVAGWFVALGAEWIVNHIRRTGFANLTLGIGVAGTICVQIALHHRVVDESDNHLVEDYVQNVLDGIPRGGLYVSGQWDYTVSPLVYYQAVEHVRPDVSVVDKNLLMNRPWYFVQLERNCPGIFKGVEGERDRFLEQLVRFEEGKPFNRGLIQERWDGFLRGFLKTRLSERPVLVDPRILVELPQVGTPVLDGLSVRIVTDTAWRPESRDMRYRPWKGEGILVRDLKAGYVSALLQEAVLDARSGRSERAKEGVEKALEIDPTNRIGQNLKQTLLR